MLSARWRWPNAPNVASVVIPHASRAALFRIICASKAPMPASCACTSNAEPDPRSTPCAAIEARARPTTPVVSFSARLALAFPRRMASCACNVASLVLKSAAVSMAPADRCSETNDPTASPPVSKPAASWRLDVSDMTVLLPSGRFHFEPVQFPARREEMTPAITDLRAQPLDGIPERRHMRHVPPVVEHLFRRVLRAAGGHSVSHDIAKDQRRDQGRIAVDFVDRRVDVQLQPTLLLGPACSRVAAVTHVRG